jgi:hypothetical protein
MLVANRASTEVIDVFIDLNKGKGAFILGCTSPFKAFMIDPPGMGNVKN